MYNKIITVVILAVSFSIISCSNDDDSSNRQSDDDCEFLFNIKEEIPATVSRADSNDYYFNGIKTYYTVDAQRYLPEFFEIFQDTIIRLDPLQTIREESGSTVMIKGEINGCVTGNHGQPTNNLISYYLIK